MTNTNVEVVQFKVKGLMKMMSLKEAWLGIRFIQVCVEMVFTRIL